MDFLDNNKDLPTHEMKRKTKMENQRGFPGCFANLQTKLKNFPFYFTILRLLSGNQKKKPSERNSPFLFFQKKVPKLKYQPLFHSLPSLRKTSSNQKSSLFLPFPL